MYVSIYLSILTFERSRMRLLNSASCHFSQSFLAVQVRYVPNAKSTSTGSGKQDQFQFPMLITDLACTQSPNMHSSPNPHPPLTMLLTTNSAFNQFGVSPLCTNWLCKDNCSSAICLLLSLSRGVKSIIY